MAERPVAALILAGGASARMGRPKALLEHQGRTFIEGEVATLCAAGCSRVLAVDGAHRLDPELPGLAGVELVHNLRWPLGPLASVQVGLRRALALEPALAGLLVHPVERPRVRVETIAALLAAFEREPPRLWQPSFGGRSGHPMLWPRALFEALLALDPAQHSARTLVRGAAAGLRRKLELDDPGVLDNIDTPADLARLAAGRG
ncbi:MAG: nucleotidyltransferase family protein [Enhygromyxa sp.]